MALPSRGSDWGRLAGTVVLSLFLYYVNVLFFLFLVPLQVSYVRRGSKEFTLSAAVTLVGIGLLSLWRTSGLQLGSERLLVMAVEIVSALTLVVGVYVVTTEWTRVRRRLNRMLFAAVGAGVVSIPLVVLLSQSKGFLNLLHAQVQAAMTLIRASFSSGADLQAADPLFNVDKLSAFIRVMLLRDYVFAYFLILAAVWRISTMFTQRIASSRPAPLSEFYLPEVLLWPVLVSWALVLADKLLGLGIAGYIGWNLGMIGAFLYALQGIGIIQFLFARHHVTRGLRILFVSALIVLLFWPGVGMVVLVAFPIFGISELWIRYGRGQVEEPEE